jgi:hypothetical protein
MNRLNRVLERFLMLGLLAMIALGQPMKGGVFEPSSPGSGLRSLIAGVLVGPGWPGTEKQRHRAELKEDRNTIRYQSDSTGQHAADRRKEEREKVQRSWEMLQNIIIDERRSREPSLPSPPAPPGGDQPSPR